METKHFSHQHPLVFVDKLEGDEEKELLCSGCEESVLGICCYKCSVCDFFLHKSCYDLPQEIQHPVHPNHTLVLQKPPQEPTMFRYCDACLETCKRSFYYHCNSCSFDLDIKCASHWRNVANDDHRHVFRPILKQIQFTCEACGEECKDIASLCSICQLLIHTKCAHFPQTIKTVAHDHSLTRTYSLHQVKKQLQSVFCKLCYKKMDTKFAAYYCQECDYVSHLPCTYDKLLIDGYLDVSVTLDAEFEEMSLEEGGVVGEIRHFGHQHNLCLGDKELEDDKCCEGCGQIILDSFYKCDQQCQFFLHERCAKLPKKKRTLLHRHPLTLNSRGDCMFYCSACKHPHRGFSYKCDECYYDLDVQCISLPESFKHEGHQHSLFLAISSTEKCKACDSSSNSYGAFYEPVFVCTECDFVLGFECASLPLEVRYDTNLLKLSYAVEDDSGEYYCMICKEKRNAKHWYYSCDESGFAAHIGCISASWRS